MELLYVLEGLRFPVLDKLMLLITRLGEETAFLVAALLVFWCVDKRKGYYLMAVGFLGTLLNQFLKLWFRIPRPWVLDPDFAIVEQAREAATGYSFPSGHSQSAVGTFGALAVMTKGRVLRILWILIAVLVPLSRMYLGVHTPMDVLVGSGMALMLVLWLRPLMNRKEENPMRRVLVTTLILALGLLLYVERFPFPADVDPHNLQSGAKNAYTMIGSVTGVFLVYLLEKRYVNFETKAVWWVQILKALLGFVLVLAVKEGLRGPLEALFAGHLIARSVRYCLMVIAAGLLWPMTFRWFSKIGVKK